MSGCCISNFTVQQLPESTISVCYGYLGSVHTSHYVNELGRAGGFQTQSLTGHIW